MAGKVMGMMAVFLLAAACTPVEQPFVPVTREPALEQGALLPGNDARLPLRVWMPDGAPEAVIVALHGFNDYSNAFEGPGTYFRVRGIATYAYDQRGFGANESHGIWPGVDNLVFDLRQMVQALRLRHPDTPLFLLGESMGGAAVIAAASRPDFPKVEGIILSAPAVWGSETMNQLYRSTLWVLSHTIPAATVTGQGAKILASDNIPMLRALGSDPLVIKETRIDAIYGIVSLMDTAYANVGKVKDPMLLLYGARDQVIPPQPIGMALQKIQAPFNVVYYPEGYHMLLRDLKAEVVLNDIVSWVKNPRQQVPSGYDRNWRQFLQ